MPISDFDKLTTEQERQAILKAHKMSAEGVMTTSQEAKLEELIASGLSQAKMTDLNSMPSASEVDAGIAKANSIQNVNDVIAGLNSSASEIDGSVAYSNITEDSDSSILSSNATYRLNTDGSLLSDSGWQTSDYIPITRKKILTGFAYSTERVCIATYDKDYNLIQVYYGDTVSPINNIFYYKTIILLPTDCAYVRIVSSSSNSLTPICKQYKFLNEAYDMNLVSKKAMSSSATNMLIDAYLDLYDTNATYRLNTDGSLLSDSDWDTTDYIPVLDTLVVRGYAYSTSRAVIATYDKVYNLIQVYYGDTTVSWNSAFYYKDLELTPEDCAYVRVSGDISNNLAHKVQKYAYAEDIFNEVSKQNNTTDDAIFFTVQVNQDFHDVTTVGDTTTVQDSETLADVHCAMYLPSNYRATGKPCKIAVCMHGAGGMVTDSSSGELSLNLGTLVANGYVVFDVNGSNNNYVSHSDHMGSVRALEAYNKAFEYIKDNYNVEDKLYVRGASMGGLTALNYLNNYPHNCKVLGLFMPVTDMYNQAWLSPWYPTTKEQIAIEYNFDDLTGATWEADKVVGFNPIENNVQSVPIKIWHGNADTVVSLSGSEALITRLKNNGVQAHLRIVDGSGHSAIGSAKEEVVYWFNRF